MKIRKRLTLQYTAVTALVFLLTMFSIYLWSEHSRSQSFYRNLRKEAVTKAHLFLSGSVSAETMHSVYLNNTSFLDEVEVAVYEEPFEMIYHDAIENDIVKETSGMIGQIAAKGDIAFEQGSYQVVGMNYRYGDRNYIVTAAARDGYGHANLRALRNMLVVLSVLGLTVIFLVGYFLSRLALEPVKGIVSRMQRISPTHISERLPISPNKDELDELSQSFNVLLDDLEKAFHSQKLFVSNVSHELRTPMAALVAETEVTLLKPREKERYEQALNNVLQDARKIIRLTDGLLDLAKADYNPGQIKMEDVRMDELLMDARTTILAAHPDYHVEIVFGQEAEDDSFITVSGNVYLLTTAFVNLIENNCKFSANRTSIVQIGFDSEQTFLRFSDNGIGIPQENLAEIFEPFYRGTNGCAAPGHGIGLALAKKIFLLHGGSIELRTAEQEGTTFIVALPHL